MVGYSPWGHKLSDMTAILLQLPTNGIEGYVLLATSEVLVMVVPIGFKHNCRKPIFIEFKD